MGKHGSKSKAPGGYGTINPKGYRRITIKESDGKYHMRMEHRVIWEQHNGPIPDGCDIHHINGDKLDNRIENLECLNRTEHKREHLGMYIKDGIWWKHCSKCDEWKSEEHYYRTKEGWMPGQCKSCRVKSAIENKRKRKQKHSRDD